MQVIPFFWAVMSTKTFEAYEAVLNELLTITKMDMVEIVMTDFEQALRNACTKAFPNARCAGCNFHHDRVCIIFIFRKHT